MSCAGATQPIFIGTYEDDLEKAYFANVLINDVIVFHIDDMTSTTPQS